jgi:hypothetical protein
MLDSVLTYNAAEAGQPDRVDLTTWTDTADPCRGGEPSQPQLTFEQRRELLTSRCFITTPEPAPIGDHYPYRDYLQVPT